ncbi:MAG: hypothetical protein A2Z28_08285 [Chloroflexi bacterium RBG_16_51_9]|nr:MAG: hypothetical protein A2Z28_08285 [Chloroflexi bacterium RBG_16_51_9]
MAHYWLCPLYSFSSDIDTVSLTEGIQIIRIPAKFVEYLAETFGHSLKTIPSRANWVVLIPYRIAASNGVNREALIAKLFREHDRATNLLVDFISVLRLYKKGRVVAGLLTSAELQEAKWTIGGDTVWTPVSSIDFFEEDPIYEFRQVDVPEVNDLMSNICKWREAKVLDKIHIALERFHSGYHGPIEDRLIYQVIAFESLYLHNDQELTYKLALRIAFLLGKRRDKRKTILSDIKQAYNYRSRIVHGDNPPKRVTLKPAIAKTEDYLRHSIKTFLQLLAQGKSLREIQENLLDENILKDGKLLTL